MTDLERCARAAGRYQLQEGTNELYRIWDYEAHCYIATDLHGWIAASEKFQTLIARAVLECLKTPSEGMGIAALQSGLDFMRENDVDHLSPFEDYPKPTESVRVMWTAMIDHVLSNGK